uniref:Uncharacterized protein n=1 Tax=Alexandrium catenella TaxID=2925 RepID=A0A7S1MBV1_ALECA|mmetsp:Transcript_23826/g.64914  ORF Transcript_23826/g.64914 Transcript_23826/m.64914 type:complete len:389 (+) Transcript_23826:74-1240(+)
MAVAPHHTTLLEGSPELQGLKAHMETDGNGVILARQPFFDTLEGMILGFHLHSVLLLLAVPSSFALTHYGGLRGMYAAYAMLPVILLASGTVQAHAYKKLLRSWAQVPTWAHGEIGSVFTKFEDLYKFPLIGCSLPFAHASVATWLALPEAIDPLLDGVTAGMAGSLLDEDAAAAFSESWRGRADGIGNAVASWGMEGTLIRIVIIATAGQLFQQTVPYLRRSGRKFLNHLHEDDAGDRIYTAMVAADGMTSVAGLLGGIRNACLQELGVPPQGSNFKLFCKVVVENLPSAWFTTSMLGLSLAFGTAGPLSTAVTIASIATSLATMALLAYQVLAGLWPRYSPFAFLSFVVFSGMLAVAIRVCGCLYCGLQADPALFSLTDGCSQHTG